MPAVAFYISGHGFGHASRQIEIVNALSVRLPRDFSIVVRTSAPRWLFDRTLRAAATFAPAELDTGIIQIDSLRLDEPETVRAARHFYATFAARSSEEAAFLRAHDVRLVVADAPPLAPAASDAVGIPCIVISNFTWDWIYEGYECFRADEPDTLQIIRDAYAKASAGWRLPMHGGFRTFATIEDLPFVARHATHPKAEVLDALGLPESRPLVLSSFGGYGVQDLDLASLDCRDEWTVVITGDRRPSSMPDGVAFVEEGRMYDAGLRYEDLVAAVDVVATKPGYGIISECVANSTAVLYTSRGRFPEYDVMVREMPGVLRCAYIAQASLLAGRWRAPLDALLAAPPPAQCPGTNGASVAADRIIRTLMRP